MDVRETREALGLSQPGLAKELGVDQATVSRWESGRSAVPGPVKKLMARMLDDLKRASPSPEQPGGGEAGEQPAGDQAGRDGEAVDTTESGTAGAVSRAA